MSFFLPRAPSSAPASAPVTAPAPELKTFHVATLVKNGDTLVCEKVCSGSSSHYEFVDPKRSLHHMGCYATQDEMFRAARLALGSYLPAVSFSARMFQYFQVKGLEWKGMHCVANDDTFPAFYSCYELTGPERQRLCERSTGGR